MTKFGVLGKPGKATGKDLGLLSAGFGVARELLHRTSWAEVQGDAQELWHTGGGTGQGWTHSTGGGLPRQLNKAG